MSEVFNRHRQKIYLLTAAFVTVTIWQVPFGGLILYPFTILSTWFHEMGHGLTAMLFGAEFRKLEIFANGSGLATYGIPITMGRLGRAAIAAGGPLGPAIAGALLILSGRWPKSSRAILSVLAVLMLVSLWWMRTLFGWVAIFGWVAFLGWTIWKGPKWLQVGLVPFLGVQACVSTFRQLSYLMSANAVIDGQRIPSDTGQIAQQLGLSHWFWGILLGAITLGILIFSVIFTFDEVNPDEKPLDRSAEYL